MQKEYSYTVKLGTSPEPWAHLRKPNDVIPPMVSGYWAAHGGEAGDASIEISFRPGKMANLRVMSQSMTAKGFREVSAFCEAVAKQLDNQA